MGSPQIEYELSRTAPECVLYAAPEILEWLEQHGCDCAGWAAVDDIDLLAEAPREMRGHAIHTSIEHGLTAEAMQGLLICPPWETSRGAAQ